MAESTVRPLTAAELEVLRARLKSLGLSVKAAAKAIGVTPETLLSAIHGRRVQWAKRELLTKTK